MKVKQTLIYFKPPLIPLQSTSAISALYICASIAKNFLSTETYFITICFVCSSATPLFHNESRPLYHACL